MIDRKVWADYLSSKLDSLGFIDENKLASADMTTLRLIMSGVISEIQRDAFEFQPMNEWRYKDAD